jgi:hypothetical protein
LEAEVEGLLLEAQQMHYIDIVTGTFRLYMYDELVVVSVFFNTAGRKALPGYSFGTLKIILN